LAAVNGLPTVPLNEAILRVVDVVESSKVCADHWAAPTGRPVVVSSEKASSSPYHEPEL
jgi:hypothetical protein